MDKTYVLAELNGELRMRFVGTTDGNNFAYFKIH